MKYTILVLSMILLCQLSRAQEMIVDLNTAERLETDFEIVQLIDKRPEKGKVRLYSGDQYLAFKLGFVNEIGSFFNQYLEFPADAMPVIISINKLTAGDENSRGTVSCEAAFFIRNGDMLIMLGEYTSENYLNERSTNAYTTAIEECLMSLAGAFDQSDWRQHSMVAFMQKKALEEQKQAKVSDNSVRAEKLSSKSSARNNPIETSQKSRLSIVGGYSYRFGNIPAGTEDDWEKYLEGLNHGFNIGLRYVYYFSQEYGLGLVTNFMFLQNTYQDLEQEVDTNVYETHDWTEKLSIGYLGPALFARKAILNDRIRIHGFFSLGYMYYQDDLRWDRNLTLTGSTIGFGVGLLAETRIKNNFFVNLGFSYLNGKLNSIDDGSFRYYFYESENISHLDINAGFSFKF
ncbi:MAG: hypothetical protein U5Q03_16155 [Bacteroidota bacterium]|nr:hypothetical protein [Bacteroidota bacterium]